MRGGGEGAFALRGVLGDLGDLRELGGGEGGGEGDGGRTHRKRELKGW